MAKLRHCGILVHDLDISIKLFRDVFGFIVINTGIVKDNYAQRLFNMKNLHLTYVKMKSKGSSTRLELWKIRDIVPGKDIGLSHISLTVENIEKIYKEIKERKLETLSVPINSEDKKVKLFFFKDYTGNLIEVVEDKK